MGITFTDKRKFLKGTALATASDPANGKILYQSNKFQTGNVETSVNMGEIRAGIGNAIVATLPSDPNVNVNFTAADFSLMMKAMQTGARYGFGAPVMVCVDVKATGTSLTVPVATSGTPVAGLGYKEKFCYVQKVGAASELISDGVPYPISDAGAISGFTAVADQTYKIWYYVDKATAEYAAISSNFDPNVVHFEVEMAVYANESGSADKTGTRVGTLYVVIPYLKLGGNGGVNGDQSSNDTTSASGMAISYDQSVVQAGCDACSAVGADLAYYLYVPCDDAGMIEGLVIKGGVISLPVSSSAAVDAYLVVKSSLAKPDPAKMSYSLTSAPSGTTVSSAGVISSGATTGNCELTATYTDGEESYECVANVAVVSA